ncbi:deoxyguanosinetriphosphate triphosphohydrolase [Burkholderia oklahomensis]|uniref:Deoxyguanosinetriphosphate triphosphohydrolase-like protein n=1 Tax=Burkholderia oklahomensis TaxID=342113 RepID=A0AAI8B9Y2_9BURK|nr:deoxyguanosinetriphosphate triphosphohydrolase [Burkholderia oklahomensis]AIO68189.1 dGTPase family protein [Burkholderia oklahomensis]AOI41044.1 deoxyguanosinetriphosphate triphosphohydrolase [Burkholderia oklahomensis EO147]KUY66673.1 deoxyguanosinetriphosphate triphosphohydrolase [Burkholderia oklahomensis EO147]MDN7674151.1 deoxyguanosinetriphosphate triphosphohydrolase [Burkholderia oklahomensis]QPS35757.1 deoxyguanosinetriphosphate triphosphohydrolase [Burkholderia oklahomensis]
MSEIPGGIPRETRDAQPARAGGERAIPVAAPTTAALEAHLAPYAAHASQSRGRRYPEAPPAARTEFQRDRDRIVHSTAFRRLEYKTQVFVNHEGDLFRTRLTHSLEVAQIARSVARNLRLNEDLVEAISLAHDLGHTPFGHAGQDALNACMRDYGGFEHNLQSLAVVDELEEHYGAFNGLNLCFETREGILKHCSRENARKLGELGERFLQGRQPSLEAQLANIADEIAYNNHDVDDGLRSGLITIEQLAEVELWQGHYEAALAEYPHLEGRRLVHETVRRIINTLIVDLIDATTRNLARHAPTSLDDVRAAPPLVAHGERIAAQAAALKRFLFKNLYRHYRVMRMASKAQRVVTGLFNAFTGDPRLLPPDYQAADAAQQPRLVAHYIAGMTDRFALKEYQRLFVMDEN